MVIAEDVANKVLGHLRKHGQTNTFKLATELGIDRHELLNIVKRLREKQAIEIRSGIARFLKFPRKEKKVVKKRLVKVKKATPKPKKKAKHKKIALENIQAENKRLKETILQLEQKANIPPRVIRRTKVKKIIQKVPVKSEKFKEQTERIKELEEKIKELQSAPPKVIRRTIVKKVPEIIRKVITKKVPINIKDEKPKKKIRFKLPKINFLGLGKSIKRLHVPEMLRK